jgi:hypothetical protein
LIQLPPDLTDQDRAQISAIEKSHAFNPRKDTGW